MKHAAAFGTVLRSNKSSTMKSSACLICCAVLHFSAKPFQSSAFVATPPSSVSQFVNERRRSSSLSLLFDGEWQKRKYGQNQSGQGNGPKSGSSGRIDALRDEATINALLERVLLGTSALDEQVQCRLRRLHLIGRGPLALPTRGGKDGERLDVACLFLADASQTVVSGDTTVPCLPVPLSDTASSAKRQLKLLSFAHSGKPISKSLFLTISPLLTGRDGSLWDNLPWTTWTIDPTRERLVDAAQNPVAAKYHPGKRDAFERMNGKDWYGRSLSGGNLKARLEYWLDGLDDISLYLENVNDVDEDHNDGAGNSSIGDASDSTLEVTPTFDDEAASILARRILEVEKAEATMAVAEAEQKLAILRSEEQVDDEEEGVASSLNEIEARRTDLAEVETALADIQSIGQQLKSGVSDDAVGDARSILRDFLAALTSRGADGAESKTPDAPYRGAYGYSAVVDTPEEMFWKSVLPYRSPYDLLLEIISEQLNADVIGTSLEDTSIFDNEVIIGGAVVLRRRGRPKSITVGGETIAISDEDDDYGSMGVKEGELFVVECDADEAIGLALAADLDVLVDIDILRTSSVDTVFLEDGDVEDAGEDVATVDSIPLMASSGYSSESWKGKAVSTRRTSSSQPMIPQPPKNTNAFLDFFAPKSSGHVYSTDNPIQSLEQYDSLSIQDKGRLLLSLPSFEGRLPRPRILREYEKRKGNRNKGNKKGAKTIADPNPIDSLLIPFIDESVRREYLIRDANNRGDVDEANRLREEKSKRLLARERAALARESGQDDEADLWEQEADLQANLRADVTQDEGEYSRFLDRDDWYERERMARAKRIDKKKFGTLLDGLE